MYVCIYIYIYIDNYHRANMMTWKSMRWITQLHLGDSKNTVRGYCLDIPRFEESLNK